jgi:spermidine synthase
MAAFGVTTPLVSTVLAVFMAGLALGSWAGGRVATRRAMDAAGGRAPLRAYALAEALIGAGCVLVPPALRWGRAVLLRETSGIAWDSAAYHLVSGAWVGVALLPFCIAMGATVPLALAAIRGERPAASERAFSFLYLANVVGATAGVLVTALVLVELLGFHATQLVAGSINAVLVLAALVRSTRQASSGSRACMPARDGSVRGPQAARLDRSSVTLAAGPPGALLLGLALTGLTSLAMEVIWLRQFAPYLGPEVYTFATVLATYLIATVAGSRLYRTLAPFQTPTGQLAVFTWLVVGTLSLFPLAATDPRLPLGGVARLAVGIVPFCVAVAVLTPMLVDRWSGGAPGRAGTAYAVNVLGSIAGPLVAGFLLLPAIGERAALTVLAAMLFVAGAVVAARPGLVAPGAAGSGSEARGVGGEVGAHTPSVNPSSAPGPPGPLRVLGDVGGHVGTPHVAGPGTRVAVLALAAIVGGGVAALSRGWEASLPGTHVRHDHTATVVAGGEGRVKYLFVNGHMTTSLSPVTKWMAHLPLAHLARPPENGLVICFGMGTTFRSVLSWGIRGTAVDLVPSVPPLFTFFHPDAAGWLASGRGRIVVDDGRRFLERSSERWNMITVDPPDPVEAAGSSLLYSREFHAVVRRRLKPGGILQHWVPVSEPAVVVAIARALGESFPHVRAFPAINPQPFRVAGMHFLASERPLPRLAGAALAERLPEAARADLVEWTPDMSASEVFDWILRRETSLDALLLIAPWMPALEDDRPFNEYYVVRRRLGWTPGL